jgi:hypothetical protein
MPRAVRLPLFMNAVLVLGVALPVLQGAALAAGLDAKDKADLKEATRLFQQRKYEEAEKLFVALRMNHPDMASLQRNLGLCYYYLRRPEAALFYLRDYLARKGKRISPEDREDVERWIEEMETLRVQSAAAPATAAATAPPRPAVRPGAVARPMPESTPIPGPVPGGFPLGPRPSPAIPILPAVPLRGTTAAGLLRDRREPGLGAALLRALDTCVGGAWRKATWNARHSTPV